MIKTKKMKKILLKSTCFLLIPSVLLSSCATIVSKSSWPVSIHTNPEGAGISITDKKGKEIYKGQSPATIELNSGAGFFARAEYQVKLSSPGFNDKIIPITCSLNGWYWGNILIGGFLGMLIIDPATGAMWKISDSSIDQTLTKSKSNASIETTPSLKIVNIKDVSIDLKSKLVRIN